MLDFFLNGAYSVKCNMLQFIKETRINENLSMLKKYNQRKYPHVSTKFVTSTCSKINK